MDGHELAGRLRSLLRGALTMVAITGYGQDTDRQRSRHAGFHEHLTKPLDFKALATMLERSIATTEA
jgi:CheY-like chemotaxis protein